MPPAPLRPVVPVALVREYAYAYAVVSPQDGALDWMLTLNGHIEYEHRMCNSGHTLIRNPIGLWCRLLKLTQYASIIILY